MIKKKLFLAFLLFTFLLGYSQETRFNVTLKSPPVGLSENTDNLGLWHNEAVDYVLTRLTNSTFTPNQSDFANLLTSSLEEFCLTKGVDVKFEFNGDFEAFFNKEKDANICLPNELSTAARSIICSIKSNVDNFINEAISLETFKAQAENLRLQSETLPDETERKICGITAATSKHSMQFWNDNFDRYYDRFRNRATALKKWDNLSVYSGPNADNLESNAEINDKKAFRIRWGLVGASDVGGAFTWARACLPVAGVLGAVAGGFAGACGHSLVSMIGQAIASLF